LGPEEEAEEGFILEDDVPAKAILLDHTGEYRQIIQKIRDIIKFFRHIRCFYVKTYFPIIRKYLPT
jgi:hypothetical protein